MENIEECQLSPPATDLKVGDVVVWDSQSHGSKKTKRGFIVAIIGAYSSLGKDYFIQKFSHDHSLEPVKKPGKPRKTVSYLVSVPSAGRGKPRLYWPRAEKLRKI